MPFFLISSIFLKITNCRKRHQKSKLYNIFLLSIVCSLLFMQLLQDNYLSATLRYFFFKSRSIPMFAPFGMRGRRRTIHNSKLYAFYRDYELSPQVIHHLKIHCRYLFATVLNISISISPYIRSRGSRILWRKLALFGRVTCFE